MKPFVIQGGKYSDHRGTLSFNNDYDATLVKRIYCIESETGLKRGWQGHKIEKRWFSAVAGRYKIYLVKVDNWEHPSTDLEVVSFTLEATSLDVLYVPAGYISCLEALDEKSKLLVLADYALGETNDQVRFDLNYFTKLTQQQ